MVSRDDKAVDVIVFTRLGFASLDLQLVHKNWNEIKMLRRESSVPAPANDSLLTSTFTVME